LNKTTEKLKEKPTNLQFVYVASCHSEKVGEIFLQIGVPHVICINQNQTILDKAAVDFSKFFYDEVFDNYSTICEAFDRAKAQVQNIYGAYHANKILLKTNPDTHEQANLQKCRKAKRNDKVPDGFINRMDQFSILNNFPTKVRPFLFRNKDMFEVLKLLTQHRIVQIYGMPGMGKSSLLKNVSCYIGERNHYKDGLVYIDFTNVTTCKEAL